MMVRLQWLTKWPEEQLWKTMPNCFRACYGTKVVAIVDCYEIKIEKPSHLVAKSATWSQYKHANTAKVFISMCPQGVTTFVSCAWGGRMSDKHLTVHVNCVQNYCRETLSLLTAVLTLMRMLPECRKFYKYPHSHMDVCSCLHKILRKLTNWQMSIYTLRG